MIKSFLSLKDLAVFKDFVWNQNVFQQPGRVQALQKINIIYGRNYSGKTTLSRVLRSLETGFLPQNYSNAKFTLELSDGSQVLESNPTAHNHSVRVFNEDFIRDNLRFIVDDQQDIKSFAVLGEDNSKIEIEIEALEKQLGNPEDVSSLLGLQKLEEKKFTDARRVVSTAVALLEEKFRNKANQDIKYKPYGNPTYNIKAILKDIESVTAKGYTSLTEKDKSDLSELIKEEPLAVIPSPANLSLSFESFTSKATELLEKKIGESEPIQELLRDITLQEWVRQGIALHKEKTTTCGFCGSPIPGNLFKKLDKHFSKESESLRTQLETLKKSVEFEKAGVVDKLKPDQSVFYSKFHETVHEVSKEWKVAVEKYQKSLDMILKAINQRLKNILTPTVFDIPENHTSELQDCSDKYVKLIEGSNAFSSSLNREQNNAKRKLRLDAVNTFVIDIDYSGCVTKNKELEEKKDIAAESLSNARKAVQDINDRIGTLRIQLKDERRGADRVNFYLTSYFGHDSLSLRAVEEETGYRFEVIRDGKKAYHLSEGECSLIAFCYFIGRLASTELEGISPIIWIDDPISSLDSNHIFFLYSLINCAILKKGKFEQVFISTHNLEFLRFLKRVHDKDPNGQQYHKCYLVVERTSIGSIIRQMPKYLRNFVTEFNYLFHQLYKCANAVTEDDDSHDCFYSFGNNARKFLDSYLYYKYPNAIEHDKKLERFFGEDKIPAVLSERISNEYSHMEGLMERGRVPVDVPEMKRTATLILDTIKEKDEEQYNALLESIGEVTTEIANA